MAFKKRGKWLSLYKRVPKRYESVEPRKLVWLSLHTDSQSIADQKASAAWGQMIDAWEAKLAGDTSDAEQRFAAARIWLRPAGSDTCALIRLPSCPRSNC